MKSIEYPRTYLVVPRPARPRVLKLALALAAVALLSGCAANQQMVAHLTDAEAFLTRAAAAYGTTPPSLKLEGVSNAASYASVNSDDPGAIHVRAQALEWETGRLHRILAHEYGHILLNNSRNGTTMAVEIDTDVKGVEILMKADGLTEREAFEAFYWGHGGRTAMLPPFGERLAHAVVPFASYGYDPGILMEQAYWDCMTARGYAGSRPRPDYTPPPPLGSTCNWVEQKIVCK